MSEDEKTQHITRRRFLQGAATATAVGVGLAGVRLGPHNEETRDSADFLLKRRNPEYENSYMPADPENILPQEVSDSIYQELELGERYKDTLNKESFHVLSQRVSRLASIYFKPNEGDTKDEQEAAFYEFNKQFFDKLSLNSDELKTDFVGVLLTWQVSGANTSSVKALRNDIKSERMRVGSSVADNLLGPTGMTTILDHHRQNMYKDDEGSLPYYAIARIEGTATLGIHDIETVMIAQGIDELEETLPGKWDALQKQLIEDAPGFMSEYKDYLELYSRYDQVSTRITREVNTPEVEAYLKQFNSKETLTEFLSYGELVDAYQMLRTTVFWANISELDQMISMSAFENRPQLLEQEALKKTVDQYLNEYSVKGFFLDQITNPKMVMKLTEDANSGDETAQLLLQMSTDLDHVSDLIIQADRSMNAELVSDNTEQKLDYQILSGVAYSRSILGRSIQFETGEYPEEINFETPSEAGYYAFLATGNRETGPSYQLAGSRPLTRATLPFVEPTLMYETMDNFIKDVYQEVEPIHPKEDFKTFVKYFLNLSEERYFRQLFGTQRHILDDDPKKEQFLKQAKEFGAYRNIITPPHCSWLRSLEATVGYTAEINKRK